MTKILTLNNIRSIVQTLGFETFILGLIKYLEQDYSKWLTFDKCARVAFYKNKGVMELMPICGDELFAFKYVNGHPDNTLINKLTVIGMGLLADTTTGEPILLSEMTLLTALRTSATSAMASKYLANDNISNFGIIGCGSQSEFQTLAHYAQFKFKRVFYFDLDNQAMAKFKSNLTGKGFELIACNNAQEVASNSQIITTCTACVESQKVLELGWLKAGQHLNCIGGDSPNKTELDVRILHKAKIVVEYMQQTCHEGEIQNLGEDAKDLVQAELWEVITGLKKVRNSIDDITLFDSVGFALEDYSVLRYVNDLSSQLSIFTELDMTPTLKDCKDLYSRIETRQIAYQSLDSSNSRLTANSI